MLMGSLSNDLEKFLKFDGVRILIESGAVRTEPWESLKVEDIDDFAGMELKGLNEEALEDLMDKVEDLRSELEDDEPEESEEHDLWEDRISECEDFYRPHTGMYRQLGGVITWCPGKRLPKS